MAIPDIPNVHALAVLLAALVVGAFLSAFMNNTPIVVLMLPLLIGAAIRSKSSTSGILLPMAYKTNLLVMTAGGYKFSDFVKVGTPLTILMWATLSFILSMAYDL